MATFTAVLRKEPNSKGERSIFIRVSTTYGDSYKSIGRDYKCSNANWDKVTGYMGVGPDKDYSGFVNARIDKVKGDLRKKYMAMIADDQEVLPSDVTDDGLQVSTDFIAFFEKYQKTRATEGTRRRFKSILSKLKAFSPRLPVRKITREWITDYDNHLKSHYDNEDGTRASNLKGINEAWNAMPATERLPNPWARYKKPKFKERQDYLMDDQLDSMANVAIPAEQKRFVLQKMFVFACINCGVRVSDLLLMETIDLKGDRIVFDIKKTPKVHSIPILNHGQKMIDSARENFLQRNDGNPSRWVFPVLPENLDLKNEVAVHVAISSATAVYNTFLKELALMAAVSGVKPSSHLARHTFATTALRKGMSLEYIASLMGITIRQAAKYAKLIKLEVEKKAREIMD